MVETQAFLSHVRGMAVKCQLTWLAFTSPIILMMHKKAFSSLIVAAIPEIVVWYYHTSTICYPCQSSSLLSCCRSTSEYQHYGSNLHRVMQIRLFWICCHLVPDFLTMADLHTPTSWQHAEQSTAQLVPGSTSRAGGQK